MNTSIDIKKLHEKMTSFLDQLLLEAKEIGFNNPSLLIDHICYRVETKDRYSELKIFFSAHGSLLIEAPINSRLISTFKMNQPFKYKSYTIPLLELPEPKPTSFYSEGFEHIEYVLNKGEHFEDIIKKYPDLNFNTKDLVKEKNPDISIKLKSGVIKLHKQSLEKVISEELKQGLNL